jgi:transposase
MGCLPVDYFVESGMLPASLARLTKDSTHQYDVCRSAIIIAVPKRVRYDQYRRKSLVRRIFLQETVMKPYGLEFRQKIVDTYFNEDTSQRKVAKRFGVALSFVEKLLKQLRDTGDLAPKPHGGGPKPKLNAEQIALVNSLVEADNDATLEELCEQIKEKTSITISRSTMGRVVQQLNLTRKKKTLHATEKDTPRVQKMRVDYWQSIRDIDPENLVFIDESGIGS